VEGLIPAIVSRDLFEAANAARTRQPIPPGDTTRDLLLPGLAFCSGCAKTLKVVRRPRADRSYVVSYYCKNAASEACRDRAYVHADELDSFVADWFAEALAGAPRMIDVVAAGRDLEQAQAERAEAEAELAAYVVEAKALNSTLFQRGLESRQAKVEETQARVAEFSGCLMRLPHGGSLLKLWDTFSTADRSDVLRGFIDRIDVSRGASSNFAENIKIFWADGTVADLKQRVRKAAA
jgi:hypothetical protein